MRIATRLLLITSVISAVSVDVSYAAPNNPEGDADGKKPAAIAAGRDGASASKGEESRDRSGKAKLPADRVLSITVEDNTKTKDQTVILVSGLAKGDRFDPTMIDRVRANLVDSGLFKYVDVSYIYDQEKRGYRIQISAHDKHSWIIAPTYYNQPTNKGLGLGYGENNLFGENKKLLLYGQVATGDSFFIGAYIDPSIFGSSVGWQFDTYLLSERTIEYVPPQEWRDQAIEARISRLQYLNIGMSVRFNLTRRLALDVRLRGADVSYFDPRLAEGAEVTMVSDEPVIDPDTYIPPDPGMTGYDVSTEIKLEYDTRANWYGVSHGERYRLSAEYALPFLLSDFEYWNVTAELVRARRYFAHHNFIAKGQLGYGHHLPFQREYTGGGTSLRGFKNDQYRGNAQGALTLEYSVPVVTVQGVSLRALAFVDSSYTAFLNDGMQDETYRDFLPAQKIITGLDEFDLTPWKNTVGMGIRLNIRQIVLPLLGVDFGYGIERRSAEIYLAIGLTDV